jgi:hypothetical protein
MNLEAEIKSISDVTESSHEKVQPKIVEKCKDQVTKKLNLTLDLSKLNK